MTKQHKINVVSKGSVPRAEYYNEVIDTNQPLFELGSVLSAKDLAKLVDIKPVRKNAAYQTKTNFNLALLTQYTSLNKLLALRGIALTSQNYYSTFKVVPASQVAKRSGRYTASSRTKAKYSRDYKKGFSEFKGNWSKLDQDELKQAALALRSNIF